MDKEKLQKKITAQLLRSYVSGVPIEILEARYGYRREKIYQFVEDFRDGKIGIFEESIKTQIMKGIDSRDEELQKLKNENDLLKHELKMANITIEGYEIMQRIYKEEYGIDLSKKSGAESFQTLKKITKK